MLEFRVMERVNVGSERQMSYIPPRCLMRIIIRRRVATVASKKVEKKWSGGGNKGCMLGIKHDMRDRGLKY